MSVKKLSNKQHGFVSIIVAAVLMILVSLITIGFTRFMQREQRQALDRQLSTQAFYAAETAVNDVRSRIQDGTIVALGDEKVGCNLTDWNNGVVDPATPTVTYTCLEYDRTPLDLVFTDTITTSSSKVFPIEANSNIARIVFEWTDAGKSTNINAATDSCPSSVLPAVFTGGSTPILRIDLIQTPNVGTNITRDNLINSTATMYLFPKTACGATAVNFVDYIGVNSGRLVDVDCDTTSGGLGCATTVNMPLPAANYRYYARIKSIYENVGTFRVTAFSEPPGNQQLQLKNAQAIVDATGKANDVLRRIEVRLSSIPDNDWPEAVIESSEGLCKQLQVAPPETVAGSNCYN